jgi:hypothetical protein
MGEDIGICNEQGEVTKMSATEQKLFQPGCQRGGDWLKSNSRIAGLKKLFWALPLPEAKHQLTNTIKETS